MLTRPPQSAKSPRSAAPLSKPPVALLTGFEPFGGETVNPSWLAVKALHGKQVAGRRIVAACLPCVFDRSLADLRQLLNQYQPELVICVGQAGGRAALSLERVAININDARIADNAGGQPIDTPVAKGGPAAYFSSLPIKAMYQALLADGVAVEVSQTAGTFVCNHVFYGLMFALATHRKFKPTRGGFIHVPFLPEQGSPSLPLDEMVRGLRLGVRAALTHDTDLALGAGAIQ